MVPLFRNTILLRCLNNTILMHYSLFGTKVIQNNILELCDIISYERLHLLICLILNHQNKLLDQISDPTLIG